MIGGEPLHHDTIYSREIRNGILKRIQRSFDPVLKDFEDDIHGIINDLNAHIQSSSLSEQMDQIPKTSRLLIRSSSLFQKLYLEYKMLYQSMTDMLSDDLVGPYVVPNSGTIETSQLPFDPFDIENQNHRAIKELKNENEELKRKNVTLTRNFQNLQKQYDLLIAESKDHEGWGEASAGSIGTRVPGDTRFFPERSRSGQTHTPPPLRDVSLHGWWGGTYYP